MSEMVSVYDEAENIYYDDNEPDGRNYCYCNQPSQGNMIGCEGENVAT